MGTNLKTNYYSPLRYPGGKGKLSHFVQLLVEHNLLIDGHYVEPYAGGASVALSLLFNEYVRTIHINDYDYRIFCFWYSAINETEEFCKLIKETKVDIETWEKQKIIQQDYKNHGIIEIGFSTFFLNRTNRSGILKAGIIGGISQNSNWKIDARFNKEDLIKRIEKISRYSKRIHLYNSDAAELIQELNKVLPQNTLFYFDPPYYKKGKDLYINFYEHCDHVQIASLISTLKNRYWLVSYDNDDNIKALYKKYLQKTYELNYHAANPSKGKEILIFSDNLIVPELVDPTNKKELIHFVKGGLFANWIGRRDSVPNRVGNGEPR